MSAEGESIKSEYRRVNPSEIFITDPNIKGFTERYFIGGLKEAKVDLELSFKQIDKGSVKWTLKHIVNVRKEADKVYGTDKSGKESIIFDDKTSPVQIYDNAKNRRHILDREKTNTYVPKEEFVNTYFTPNSSYSRDRATVNIRFVFITEDGYKEDFDAREIYFIDNNSVLGRDNHGKLKKIYSDEVEPFSVVELNNHHNNKYFKRCLERLFQRIRIFRI